MSRWVASEPGSRDIRRQLSRLRRRAFSRPIRVTIIAALFAGAVVARASIKRHKYDASVTFRVSERTGGIDEGRTHTKARLRDYVKDGILTAGRCKVLLKKFKLYPGIRALDENMAVDTFRGDIAVTVWANNFLREDWDDTGAPRTARIRINFTYYSPDVALEVARALGDLVKQHELAVREQVSAEVARRTELAVTKLKERLVELEGRRTAVLIDLKKHVADMESAQLRVELSQLKKRIADIELRLETARSKANVNNMRALLEKSKALMRFEQTDWGKAQLPTLSKTVRLTIMGAAIFLILWPFIGMGIGAFDSRVYDLDDVSHLRLRPLGHVSAFKGHKAHSQKEREKTGGGQGGADRDRGREKQMTRINRAATRMTRI